MPSRKLPQARRVVGYVRISRDRAGESSTTTQRAAIEAYAAGRGWTLVDIIVEPGQSAFKSSRTSRPGFRKAMQLVTTGAADAFVVWRVDRAARNVVDLLTFVEDLESHGAEFVSTTEAFDTTTPMGAAMLTIIAALAQMESAAKSDRATEWHRHRRSSGAVPAGRPTLGYTKPAPNTLAVDPVVAPLVHQAATSIAAGASVLSAVKMLNAAGVKITHRGLTTALRSPTMAGLVAVSDEALPRRGGARVLDGAELVEGSWPPILERDLWEAVTVILDDPRRSTTLGENRLRYPLGPVARCHCGSRMHVHRERWSKTDGTTGEMPRLLCDDTKCATGIGYDAVEENVTAAVLDVLDDDTWNRIRTAGRGQVPDAAAVEEKLARLWQMVLDGSIEPEEYAEAKTSWRGELAAATVEPVDLPDVASVRASWPDLDAEARQLVYRAAIENLTINAATRRGGRGVDLTRVDLDTIG